MKICENEEKCVTLHYLLTTLEWLLCVDTDASLSGNIRFLHGSGCKRIKE